MYTLRILELIEELRKGAPLYNSIDLIAGTSVGGLVALGVAHGKSATSMRVVFEELGPGLFRCEGPRWLAPARSTYSLLRSLLFSKYSSKKLQEIVAEFIEEDLFCEAHIPAAIASVSVNTGKPHIFRNYGRPPASLKSRDVAMATSAAPTYFDPHSIGADRFVDGGIIANNPDLVAICDAVQYFHAPLDSIIVISVGATSTDTRSPSVRSGFRGVLRSAFQVRHAISFTLEAQQTLAQISANALVDERYHRVNADVGLLESSVGLDRADLTATRTLINLAESSFRESSDTLPVRMLANGFFSARRRWQNGRILFPS